MPSLENILAVILAGGTGTRLYPLTAQRSKPAVPIAGKYRLIDIPISNCINSGIYRIAVLTQFNSVSLHRHITSTYNFDAYHQGWVQIWAAEQTMETKDWYQGSADAVRKQLFEIQSARSNDVLILAGDHLYRMDYAAIARFHWEKNADITVAVQPVLSKDTNRFGILKRDHDGRLTSFAEKPTNPQLLSEMVSRDDPQRPYLGSMGIYMLKTQVLFDLLRTTSYEDFGKDIIPYAIKTNTVFGFDFDGYWEDIGTIRTFYETNLALTTPDSQFDLFDADRPIYTHARFLPASIIENSLLENVMLAEGCCIKNAEIRHSIIGLRSQIRGGSRIYDSIIMGSDYYDRPNMEDCPEDIPIGIGNDCQIQGAIIDKNARIGSRVVIRPFPRGTDYEMKNWVVRDGIVVIPKNAVLLSDTYVGPEKII
jgi:glucose-1-phosphate adenylyltransferase